LVTFC